MISKDENRIQEVNRFLILDFKVNSEFQNLVDLAAKLCGTPVALLALLGEEYNYLKVRHGVNFEIMPRETSFCQYVIEQDDVLIIPDARKDSRFDNNPLVHSDPKVRFYAGVPLILNNGTRLGSLCLFDLKPNTLNELQKSILRLLSSLAVSFMELELSRHDLTKQIEEKEEKNQGLIKIAHLQSHQIRQPLTSIMGLINLVKDGYQEADSEWLQLFEKATDGFDNIIKTIVAESYAEKDVKSIRFYKMIEEIEDYAIVLLSKDGYIENWNNGAKKIKGYRYSEAVGKHFSIFYTDQDIKNNRPELLLVEAKMNGVAKDEGWRVKKDGEKFWGSIVITAIHDSKNNVVGFTKVTRDLTEITQIKDSLEVSTELNKYMAEQNSQAMAVGGWELDLLKNELIWTSITKQIHGVEQDYVPDLDNAINFYKDGCSRNNILYAVASAISDGKEWDIELQLINQQGNEIRVRTTGKSNFKDGTCTRVYGTIQAIDLAKNEDKKTLPSNEFYKETLDAASEISIISTNINGIISGFNKRAEKMLGYHAFDVIGKLNFLSFHSDIEIAQRSFELTEEFGYLIEGFNVFVEKAKKDGIEQKKWRMRSKYKNEAVVLLTVTPLRDSSENITGYLFISSDFL